MKLLTAVLLTLSLASCKGSTEFGECVGLGEQREDLIYELSARNVFWSILGLETIIAPVLWATDYAHCPIARRADK